MQASFAAQQAAAALSFSSSTSSSRYRTYQSQESVWMYERKSRRELRCSQNLLEHMRRNSFPILVSDRVLMRASSNGRPVL